MVLPGSMKRAIWRDRGLSWSWRPRVSHRQAVGHQDTTAVIIAGGPLRLFYAWQRFVPGGSEARRRRSGAAAHDLTAHRDDSAGTGKTENNPGRQSLLCQAAMDRFFVPTYAFQSRRAERRSRMPAGHRAAARSVLDGREHDGSLRRGGTTLLATPLNGQASDAGRPHINGETKTRRLCADYHRR